ncbi:MULTISPECIES: hypothetical protein [unclassified Sutcliffiella]|uniref:hypothetical protein n=1 Tax=unclassified Sutcliffiella TaxID=2837532 RepID=UPI0030D09C67
MLKLQVVRAFQDKFTRKHYSIGNTFESQDFERVSYLIERGFLEDKNLPKAEVKEPVHVGAGYYVLPNGEKVRGKTKAFMKWSDLNA